MTTEFGPAFERLLADGVGRTEPPNERQADVLANAEYAVRADAASRAPNETTFYWKTMVMASTLDVWIALLRRQKVPADKLHPDSNRFRRR